MLLARENLLYTFIDYHQDKFGHKPTVKQQEEFAQIISWNIFQMDGLRYVVPMTCFHEYEFDPQPPLFAEPSEFETTKIKEFECEGCKYNRPHKHNGIYVKIMDWSENKIIKFSDLIICK